MLQLRKQKIDRIILAGMSANLCVESHMRTLTENGFEVSVVIDATAGAIDPNLGNGYEAALVNFKMIATRAIPTAEMITHMGGQSTASNGGGEAEVAASGGVRHF